MTTLFDRPRTRPTDPETSHAAARSVGDVTERQRRILEVLRLHPGGLMHEELYAHSFISSISSPSGMRTRVSELVRMGLVADSGMRRRLMATGRMSIVWALTRK